MEFQVDQVVRIAKQPPDLYPGILGNVGYIEEMTDTMAQLQCVSLTGVGVGFGVVPLSCLVIEEDPKWLAAVQKKKGIDETRSRYVQAMAYSGRINAAKLTVQQDIATELGVSLELVKQIVSRWQKNRPGP